MIVGIRRESSQSQYQRRERTLVVPDSGFELRHLRYFVAVAEELHFGRAAKALHITQPPLTRTIQDLERQVGTMLLTRFSSKPVRLTAAGRVFLGESKRILAQVHESVDCALRASLTEQEPIECLRNLVGIPTPEAIKNETDEDNIGIVTNANKEHLAAALF